MTIQSQLTEPEIIRGILKIRRGSSESGRIFILPTVTGGFLLLFYSRRLPALQAEKYILIGCIMLGIALSFSILMPLYVRFALNEFVRTNPWLTASCETTFDEKGLAFSSSNFKREVPWTVYKNLAQDGFYIYLHSGVYGMFSVRPKRAFNDSSLQEFLRCGQSLKQA